jgi:Major Facilitator Superfamily.
MNLSRPVRYRGLIILIVINFMMYAGFFMVIPLVSVHYVQTLGFAAVTVGLALALRQLVQQGVSVGGGVLADRFGGRGLITAGVLVRAVGFVCLAFADTPLLLFGAMLLSRTCANVRTVLFLPRRFLKTAVVSDRRNFPDCGRDHLCRSAAIAGRTRHG